MIRQPHRPNRPTPRGPAPVHLELIAAMARATGADLSAAWEEGRLTPDGWARAVERCRRCGDAQGCRRWLEAGPRFGREVPEACLNAPLMRRLADGAGDQAVGVPQRS